MGLFHLVDLIVYITAHLSTKPQTSPTTQDEFCWLDHMSVCSNHILECVQSPAALTHLFGSAHLDFSDRLRTFVCEPLQGGKKKLLFTTLSQATHYLRSLEHVIGC